MRTESKHFNQIKFLYNKNKFLFIFHLAVIMEGALAWLQNKLCSIDELADE
jgi:uncharacterized radical SAM superfamily protein